jgi:hypothetical protein
MAVVQQQVTTNLVLTAVYPEVTVQLGQAPNILALTQAARCFHGHIAGIGKLFEELHNLIVLERYVVITAHTQPGIVTITHKYVVIRQVCEASFLGGVKQVPNVWCAWRI